VLAAECLMLAVLFCQAQTSKPSQASQTSQQANKPSQAKHKINIL
jgi:hypothetical protein